MILTNRKYPAKVIETNELFMASLKYEKTYETIFCGTAHPRLVNKVAIVTSDRDLNMFTDFSTVEIYEEENTHVFNVYYGDERTLIEG